MLGELPVMAPDKDCHSRVICPSPLNSRFTWFTTLPLLAWKKPQPGADFAATAREFKEATAKQPGWEPEKVVQEGIVPADAGRRIYRLAAVGKQDGLAVVQAFHLVLGPNGEHVA